MDIIQPNQTPSPEQQTPAPQKKSDTNWIALIILLILVVVFAGGVYWYQTKSTQEAEVVTASPAVTNSPSVTPTSTPTSTPSTTPTVTDETANWKTYTNDTIAFSFKYPETWKTISLAVDTEGGIYQMTRTKVWSNPLTKSREMIYFDPNKIFHFEIFPKGGIALGTQALSKKSIDVDWSKAQFAKQMGINANNLLIAKKLSSKSMLVGLYSAYEGLDQIQLSIISPLNNSYPNFEIGIRKTAFDPADGFTGMAYYKNLARKIESGQISLKLDSYIETAQKIADTVTGN
jgi:ABC-type glycerol-3-phosphate transport system permease component